MNPESVAVIKKDYLAQYEALRAEALRQSEEEAKELRRQQLTERISPRYRNKTFEDFKVDFEEQKIVKKIAMRFIQTFQYRLKEASSLIFNGNPGTGKTLLARIMEQTLNDMNFSVHYEPNLRFLRRLNEKNFESDAALQAELNHFKSGHLLIIDEATEGFAGKSGHLSDWEKQMLFTVIDLRYNEKLSTLIITNRDQKEIVERIGDRTVDRLIEKGISLAFNWESYRTKGV